jgi:hypothetical protein
MIGYSGLKPGIARTARYGGGGSGNPTTVLVVSGSRFSMPNGRAVSLVGPTNVTAA